MDNSGSAFPTSVDNFSDGHGLTKREWLAGMALQGILAGRAFYQSAKDKHILVDHAFEIADISLALSKEKSDG